MNVRATLLLVLLSLPAALAAAAAGSEPIGGKPDDPRGNVLLLILDDVGVDRVAAYGLHPDPGRTPTLDRLAARGVLFENVWASAFCMPGRATILTGRFGFRTGVGSNASDGPGELGLDLDEVTLAEALKVGSEGAYRTAVVGKWHLSGPSESTLHPLQQGFERFIGTRGNAGAYYGYEKYDLDADDLKRGRHVPQHAKAYSTSETVDDTLRVIAEFGESPWFCMVAFQAAHVPYHAPPQELHGYELEGAPEADPVLHHKAMVEALDTEIGRLLEGIAPEVLARTTVIVVGDNGTQSEAIERPFRKRGKGSLFEGGVRVPLILSGAGVEREGERTAALVNTTDLFQTVLDLVQVPRSAALPEGRTLDSESLAPYLAGEADAPSRRYLYTERFNPNHGTTFAICRQAIRGERFKLVSDRVSGAERLFDLAQDPRERHNLLDLDDEGAADLSTEAKSALGALRAARAALTGD